MKKFIELPKLKSGDQVGIVSPSAGLPQIFPWVQDLGLARMQDIFGLVPKEYPTTRMMGASLESRAQDLMDAFADTSNKAVFASIGGSDQIGLIKHLDASVFIANPKPFFGFSDNTHFHNYLWNLSIPSYYGGGVMNQFGMNSQMFQKTIDSLNHALFERNEIEITASEEYTDEGIDWSDKDKLTLKRNLDPNLGLFWDTTNSSPEDVTGVLWGGCVESLVAQCAASKYLPSSEDLNGAILYLETSEGIPENWIIEYLLTGFGERGWLNKFGAILIGRPKAWEFNKQNTKEQKLAYSQSQRETVIKTVRKYNADIPIIQNLDFGHTDPQIMIPSGNVARILVNSAPRIFLNY